MSLVVRKDGVHMICDACGKDMRLQSSEVIGESDPTIIDLCFECGTEEYGDIPPCG